MLDNEKVKEKIHIEIKKIQAELEANDKEMKTLINILELTGEESMESYNN